MRVPFFWDTKVHHGIITSRRFEGMQRLYLQESKNSYENAEGLGTTLRRKDTDYLASQKNGIHQHSTVKTCELSRRIFLCMNYFNSLRSLNSLNDHNYYTHKIYK